MDIKELKELKETREITGIKQIMVIKDMTRTSTMHNRHNMKQAHRQQKNDEKNEEEVQEDSNNNWKIAAGIGGGLVAAAGLAYGGYKINKHMKEKSKKEIEEAYQRNLASLEKANVPRMPSGNMAGYASSFNQSHSSVDSYNQNYNNHAGAPQSHGQQGGYNPNSGMPTPQHSFGPSSGAPQGYGQAGGQQGYGQPGSGPQGYGQSGGYGQPGTY
ncbi:hypothetical protein DSO57_1030013 [Entomophthora muscae]|uniref:Uncharacterized protein n=1 Tax=Entomophthora muscae TaxID=34485 RepID=A0ACC2TN33_9FUNG|nr:hypothetical protein DSO57_1030013 [Entomophthora muscae]